MRHLITACLLTIASASAFGQFDESKYEVGRIDTIGFFPTHQLSDSVWFFVLDTPIYLRTRAEYLDSVRTIDTAAHLVLAQWLEEVIQRPDFSTLYLHEIMVRQGTSVLWFPIQESLLADLTSQARSSDVLDLFVVVAGATKNRVIVSINGYDWLN